MISIIYLEKRNYQSNKKFKKNNFISQNNNYNNL